MSKGDRGFFGAIGLVAIVAIAIGYFLKPELPELPWYSYEQPDKEQYRPGGSECEPAALAAIGDRLSRLRRADTCAEKAQNYRHDRDDLVQQTRAADAASAQVTIANQGLWMGWFQTIGGFITLAAAIAAAIYARDAAKEGRRSANEAQRTADEAERSRLAYMGGERGHLTFHHGQAWYNTDTTALTISLTFENIGVSLAEIDGISGALFDEPVWPSNLDDASTGLQVKVPPGNQGTVRLHESSVELPCYLFGFIAYKSLSEPGFRSYFAVRLVYFGENPYGTANVGFEFMQDFQLPDDT